MFKSASANSYKDTITFSDRLNESTRIREKYQDRVPCIVELSENLKHVEFDKKKYLVPNDLTCGQFIFIIRKRMRIQQEEAIFLFVHNTIPPTSSLLSQIYRENKDDDGFLYFVVQKESTFGER